ncbi:hypothetical protein L915_09379 [Plasmopara halstedii]|uniref:Glycoside hydrolase n=1 Tax=Plasmopara halstedii TaxID=4781 RepID=A0A0P1AQR3_PLAHL|nr:hypothetical protein L915_09379 [Plasmopara halstedii]CEG43839.1 hypothetical protein L915_09379 [Plasmopara halstedii]|eukprot:XP_024580208.1 hypothetical protein L915_09379 [Plasmopara halstedii]
MQQLWRLSTVLFVILNLLSTIDSAVVASEARCFPPDFLFGTATAAVSVKSSLNISNHKWCSLDNYRPRSDRESDDDLNRRYIDDIQRTSDMGFSSFRFSISWSRIMSWNIEQRRMMPNFQGVALYHSILDEVLAKGLQAIVTLCHFDLPSELQTEHDPSGWLNSDIVMHFADFASLAFNQYGHKVKYWATFNEPLTFITGVCYSVYGESKGFDTAMYAATHNVLRSHATAVAIFRKLCQENESVVKLGARIGIVLNAAYGYPVDKSNAMDVAAAERKMQFDLGWFLMPLVTGDYPKVMRERVKERLPSFTLEEAAMVKGSYDVLMLNSYKSRMVTDCDSERSSVTCDDLLQGYARDRGIDDTQFSHGTRVAPPNTTKWSWLLEYSDDLLATAKWLHALTPKTQILLTENSLSSDDEGNDETQLQHHVEYAEQVYAAVVNEKFPIIGFTPSSLLNENQTPRSELPYDNNSMIPSFDLIRTSANWFARLSTTKCFDEETSALSVTINNMHETIAKQKDLHESEADIDDTAVVPWSLSEVILLVVVGLVVLGAITCEAIRELHFTSHGSPEEIQVLITIEE